MCHWVMLRWVWVKIIFRHRAGKNMCYKAISFTTEKRVETYVWFATINDSEKTLYKVHTADKRKSWLMYIFEKWHDPILNVTLSTPTNKILMERAVANKNIVNICLIPMILQNITTDWTAIKRTIFEILLITMII